MISVCRPWLDGVRKPARQRPAVVLDRRDAPRQTGRKIVPRGVNVVAGTAKLLDPRRTVLRPDNIRRQVTAHRDAAGTMRVSAVLATNEVSVLHQLLEAKPVAEFCPMAERAA